MTQLIYDTIENYNYYFKPLKPRIRFKSLDGEDTYFTFNPFDVKDINVIYVDAERAISETGTFNIVVEDSQNIINKGHLQYAKIYRDFGKTETTLKQFLIGYGDIFTIRRPRSYYQEYLISGPSTRIQAAELYISRRQASDIQDIDNPNIVPDPFYNVSNLFHQSLEKRKWRPLNQDSIDSGFPQSDFTGDLIDDTVNINYPVINEPLTPAWEFWDKLAEVAGAVWDIDYSLTDQERLMVSFNPTLHTGIIVKSGDLKTNSDDGARTAYIKSSFDIENNASADSGTATRLYTTTIIDRQVVASSNKATGFNTLNNRFLAQQVIIENDQRRITELAFIMSKIGEPDSPKSRINGEMRMDSGDNKPTGKVLATFNIDLSSIDTQQKTLFIPDVDVKVRFLEGSNKIWLIWKDRSGIKGNVENDPANTIRWHHNNILNTTQTLYSASAPASEAAREDLSTAQWNSVNTGPIYSFSIFSNIRRLQARTNMQAANKLRMKEAPIDSGFLSDPKTVATYLSLNLSKRAKARRGIADVVVRVPNDFIFAPYQWVSFNDGLSDSFQDLQVQRARIVVSALPGDPQIGALDMNLTLAGLYNSLVGTCECQ